MIKFFLCTEADTWRIHYFNAEFIYRKDTEPGQVTILFSLEYEDSKASSANSTETLTFNVSQPVRAELEVSDIPSVFYTMDTVEIPVKALNLGRDKSIMPK